MLRGGYLLVLDPPVFFGQLDIDAGVAPVLLPLHPLQIPKYAVASPFLQLRPSPRSRFYLGLRLWVVE